MMAHMKRILAQAVLPSLLLLSLGGCTENDPARTPEAASAKPAPVAQAVPVDPPPKSNPTSGADAGTGGLVHRGWSEFLAGGCDVEQVADPISARVLRNTPFAMAGHRFKSADLTGFFTKEGGYAPKDGPVQLGEKEAGCVAKLKERETALRELLDVPEPFEMLLMGHHGIVVEQFRPADEVGHGDRELCSWAEGTTISKDDAGTWKIEWRSSVKGEDGVVFEFGCVTECTPDGICRGYEYS